MTLCWSIWTQKLLIPECNTNEIEKVPLLFCLINIDQWLKYENSWIKTAWLELIYTDIGDEQKICGCFRPAGSWTVGSLQWEYFYRSEVLANTASYLALKSVLQLATVTHLGGLFGLLVAQSWSWSMSGYFCVLCPCLSLLCRKGLWSLPFHSPWTAILHSLYPPVTRNVSTRLWRRMPLWKLNIRSLSLSRFIYSCMKVKRYLSEFITVISGCRVNIYIPST